jgi:hypothetical protein
MKFLARDDENNQDDNAGFLVALFIFLSISILL